MLFQGKKRLPSGVENFEKMIEQDLYYVDKTKLIKDLLDRKGEVNLFTRPRRFGKSLTLSMLYYFFSNEGNQRLYDGLAIHEYADLCEEYMGKYPVIFISLKGVEGQSFESARLMLSSVIYNAARAFDFLNDSSRLTDADKMDYKRLFTRNPLHSPDLSVDVIGDSLRSLTNLLYKHYGKKVILLIDEYDVPLDKAYNKGYYDQMLDCIRSMFHNSMKTNDALEFAVITGCLRVAKESIFTGFNNLAMFPFDDVCLTEYFGFIDHEVRQMLSYYELEDKYDVVKAWYDGYQFGINEIFCPWDVISYVMKLMDNKNIRPRNFWANSSSNDILMRLAMRSNNEVLSDIKTLIAGGSVNKHINRELTYRDIEDSVENIWSVMYMTGYLTAVGNTDGNDLELRIPNAEIRETFSEIMESWFQTSVRSDGDTAEKFVMALLQKSPERAQKILTKFLNKVISIRDTFVAKDKKENFYHGIILGLLGYKENWMISSNKEAGDGYSDIFVGVNDADVAIIIEVKYPDDDSKESLEESCMEALEQIDDRYYEDAAAGYDEVIKYAVVCRRKRCMIQRSLQNGE